jgi:uncharacterized protein
MVAARRQFEGSLPLSGLTRLRPSLASDQGECRFELSFDRDVSSQAILEMKLEADLSLLCQRSLEPFSFPVSLVQRLGLITDEAQEAALPPGVEAVLVGPDGELNPAELIEDELILALPVVPINPEAAELPPAPDTLASDEVKPNPFAALAALKADKR